MAIKKYAGDRFTGLSGDTKPLDVGDGALFSETDTGKIYVKVSGSYVEQSGVSGYSGYSGAAGVGYILSFVDGDLSTGVLTVNHNLGVKQNVIQVYDNNDLLINPDNTTLVSTTQCTIDLTNFGTLTGTWYVVVSNGGASGYSGISGYSGVGTSGFSGISGYSGVDGADGTSGYSGYSGISGFSGAGISGYSGISGFSGVDGATGTSGYSGYSGISGYSGYSGGGGGYVVSFVDGDLSAGILAVTHNLGIKENAVEVYDNTSKLIIPDVVTAVNTTSLTIDLTTYGTLTGTWYAVVTNGGASGYSGFSGISGYSGSDGQSGYSGISGYSGADGASGYSGISGYSGDIAVLNTSPGSDLTASGLTNGFTAGENVAFGNVVYFKSDGKMWKAKGDAVATMPCVSLAIATITADNPGNFLQLGYARNDAWAWTVGGLLYVDVTTGGTMTQTRPTTAGNQVQIVGYAVSADVIYFSSNFVFVEV